MICRSCVREVAVHCGSRLGQGGLDQVEVGHEAVAGGGGARRQLVARVAGQPRVPQHVAGAEPLARLAPQQRADEALAARRQALRHHEVAARDLREQRRVLGVVERIPETKERKKLMRLLEMRNG